MSCSCRSLEQLNALLTPGEVKEFAPFSADFCLTDSVMSLWTYPEGL